MDINTTQTTATAASVVNPIDDIASLLVGEEKEQTEDESQQTGPEGAEGELEGELEGQQTEGEGEESGEGAEGEGEQSGEDLTWAKALGVDDNQLVVDEDGNLKGIQVKIDGEVSTVGVKDLIAGYQLNKHVTQKSQALAEEKREFDQLKTTASKAYYEKLQAAEKLTEFLKNNLVKEYSNIDWDTLRHQNPGEYAAAVADFQARQGQIQQIMAGIQNETQSVNEAQQQEFQQKYQEHLNQQFQKVIENNPQWADQAKMQADITEMGRQVGTMYNITPDEFAMLNDARHIEIIKDAIAYRLGKTASQHKIQKVPTFQKPGKPSKPMSQLTRLTLDARKAKGHKQRDLQSAAIAELLMGGN